MKVKIKIGIILFVLSSLTVVGSEVKETTDIRKYHQQLEERVFEVENKEEQDEKIRESFFHGKRRINDARKNEEMKLEEENKETSEKLENLKVMEEKYNKVLKEAEELINEKERLLKENEEYTKRLNQKLGGKN